MRYPVLEQFEHAWRSQRHEGKATLHTEMQILFTALDRERKRSRAILVSCLGYTLVSILAVGVISSRREVHLSEIWPAAAAQTVALIALAYLVRKRFQDSRTIPASVKETTELALNETRSAVSSLKFIAVSMGVILALVGVSVVSLSASGKMDGRSISSFLTLCLIIATFNGVILWWRYRIKLRPRLDRLNSILRDLDAH
jgi:hypothetical protein